MSKNKFRSQASSSRAVSGAFGAPSSAGLFGGTTAFGASTSSKLSYVYEPPDLGGIPKPNVIVSFKNLQKKDSTTKAKALEELQTYIASVSSNDGLEQSILEAWIEVYPRTSIDTTRRIRQLAHTIQGQFAKAAGKRIAKHLPDVVGSWLAGLYDSDKIVARAAQESFNEVFPTKEKQKNVWRIYLEAILRYVSDVIFKESVNTLSDERTTSLDDASTKYARVVGAAIYIISYALDELTEEILNKQQTLLNNILKQEKVWQLSYHDDPFVRRAIYKLLETSLSKIPKALDLRIISSCVLASSLHINQIGSTLDYARALSRLSSVAPDVWTEYYSASRKNPATKRLCQFLKKGSQGGQSVYWNEVGALLRQIPSAVLAPSPAMSENEIDVKLMTIDAFHDGIVAKDEPRSNQSIAWTAYVEYSRNRLYHFLSDVEQEQLIRIAITPLFNQYIKPTVELTRWTIPTAQQRLVCVKVVQHIMDSQTVFTDVWQQNSAMIVKDLQISLPEQSKNYSKSQEDLSAEAARWYGIHPVVFGKDVPEFAVSLVTETFLSELKAAVATLRNRSGKPYGVARLIETAARLAPEVIFQSGETRNLLLMFAQEDVPRLLMSPSATYLVEFLQHLGNFLDLNAIYGEALRLLTGAPESTYKYNALRSLYESAYLARWPNDEALKSMISSTLQQAVEDGTREKWELISTVIANRHAPTSLHVELLSAMVDGLSLPNQREESLDRLETTIRQHPTSIKEYGASPNGLAFLSKLLSLTESPNEIIAEKAQKVNNALEAISSTEHGFSQASETIVRRGINSADAESLSVLAIVNLARKSLDQAVEAKSQDVAAHLLPTSHEWAQAFETHLSRVPDPTLALINPMSCAVRLVDNAESSRSTMRDHNGFSTALRMVWYTVAMLTTTDVSAYATDGQMTNVLVYLALFLQLSSDEIGLSNLKSLWSSDDPDLEQDVTDLVTATSSLVVSWLKPDSLPDFIINAQTKLLKDSNGSLASSYYNGRAYITLTENLIELRGDHHFGPASSQSKDIRKSPNTFTALAILSTIQDHQVVTQVCNELIAELTGYDIHVQSDGLRHLALLNSIIHRPEFEDVVNGIPQQRLVFFVQHILAQIQELIDQKTLEDSWSGYFSSAEDSLSSLSTEVFRVLHVVLPPIKQIYGSIWADSFSLIKNTWSFSSKVHSDKRLPVLNASLRLLSVLRRMNEEDPNDDLQDAWSESLESVAHGMLSLLQELRGSCADNVSYSRAAIGQSGKNRMIYLPLLDTPDTTHQPRRIVNELLARQLSTIPASSMGSIENDLYSVLASESLALQQAAYNVLHRRIPSMQEDLSLEKALSKDHIFKIPEELLSLVLEAPILKSASFSFERTVPPVLRSYLHSWNVIFDHWTNASDALKADYISSLKDGTYLNDLLVLVSEFLITSRSKPIEASKFKVGFYVNDPSASPEKDTQHLLIHLYYLALKHVPTLCKNWWRDSTSRQTQIAVESWTEKYISPTLIVDELATVNDWAPSANDDSDLQPLTIKTSLPAREITASIPIDEQTMSIAIHLPPSYPLSRATVTGLRRVGVTEQKWRSWIITTQGVINFSDVGGGGQLVDGLMAWRKNVTATLKGQSECAICYSVVSADRQLPSKRCGTCKNLFHGSCLFKWFKSSNSSGCPLCRNQFSYS
ncbi:MAG: hypothetical protein Q9167_005204 [Letrouitia subvulpina]